MALYGGLPREAWNLVHTIGICSISCSVVGSAYIIYSTLADLKKRGELPLSDKFPMFIAIADIAFAFSHGTDHALSLATDYVSSGGICVILGWWTGMSMNFTATWVFLIAYFIFSTVVLRKKLNFGKNDWKLHAFGWGVPFLWSIPPFFHAYGNAGLWCGYTTAGTLVLYNTGFVFIAIATDLYLYGRIAHYLLTYVKLNATGPAVSQSRRHQLRSVAKTLPVFVLIYIIQWSAYSIWSFTWLAGTNLEDIRLIYAIVFVTNLGGVLNGLAYRLILKRKRNNVVPGAYLSPKPKTRTTAGTKLSEIMKTDTDADAAPATTAPTISVVTHPAPDADAALVATGPPTFEIVQPAPDSDAAPATIINVAPPV